MNDKRKFDESGERIAKVIARSGLASRREAEAWVAAGRVAVNGAPIDSPAINVGPSDRITVDGEALPVRERTRLFLYHKPRGLLTAHSDPRGRPTIFQRLPKHLPHLISVGRLDFNTEGLLLLTNDGALARMLELPSTGWLRRYRVRAHGSVTQEALDTLRNGITVDSVRYGPIEATLDRVQGSNLWLTFAIREGKNREVRNVLGHLGLTVARLIRISFGPFQLGELPDGAVEEVPTRVLREQLGDRLVEDSGADFSGPVAPPPAPAVAQKEIRTNKRPKLQRGKPSSPDRRAKGEEIHPKKRPKPYKSSSHTWRAKEDERPAKKLRRKFHGPRHDDERKRERLTGEGRSGVVSDRKGRTVKVERYGEPPAAAPFYQDEPNSGRSKWRSHRQDGHRRRPPRGR